MMLVVLMVTLPVSYFIMINYVGHGTLRWGIAGIINGLIAETISFFIAERILRDQ